MTLNVEVVQIADLHNDPSNVRTHDDKNIAAIKGSLARFGQQKPIVVGPDNVVVAGNGTLRAATDMGWTEIQIVRTELTGVDVTAFAIADNRTAELADWDLDALHATMIAINKEDPGAEQATAITVEDIKQMGWCLPDVELDEVAVGQIPDNPETNAGDVWVLGDNRIMCGDCRASDDVTKLMAGAKVTVAVTSPPYASQRAYDESSGFKPIPTDEYSAWFDGVQANVRSHLADDGSWFVNIKEHCEDGQRVLYVKDLALAHVREWGWSLVDEFAWTHGGTPKNAKRRFKNGWEPIFQFTKGGETDHKFRPDAVKHASGSVPPGDELRRQMGGNHASHRNGENQGKKRASKGSLGWGGYHPSRGIPGSAHGQGVPGATPKTTKYPGSAKSGDGATRISQQQGGSAARKEVANIGMAYPSNVLSLGRNREALGHAAAYPQLLPAFFIDAYSDKGDAVYDPFMGSGTTLMAAQAAGRPCYGMEISPAYVDVIVRRWQAATGETATLEGSGAAFPVAPVTADTP